MNDLYSCNKEVDAKYRGNTVHQIQEETRCSSAAAMELVHGMVLQEKETFSRNCEKILKDYSTNRDVHKYVAAAQQLVAANVQSLTNDERYSSANDRAAALPDG